MEKEKNSKAFLKLPGWETPGKDGTSPGHAFNLKI
jgi:hypothetical protein